MGMYSIKLTPAFEAWLAGLKDNTTHLCLARRLDKAASGNLGDVKPVGNGLSRCASILAPAGGCIICSGAEC